MYPTTLAAVGGVNPLPFISRFRRKGGAGGEDAKTAISHTREIFFRFQNANIRPRPFKTPECGSRLGPIRGLVCL